MDKVSNPLDAIIDFAWAAGADRFWVNNAKDELKRLRAIVSNQKSISLYENEQSVQSLDRQS